MQTEFLSDRQKTAMIGLNEIERKRVEQLKNAATRDACNETIKQARAALLLHEATLPNEAGEIALWADERARLTMLLPHLTWLHDRLALLVSTGGF